MAKAFRYLLITGWANLAAIPITALIITVLTALTGAPIRSENMFATYFVALPLICLLFLFIFGASLCSISLHIALSLAAAGRTTLGLCAASCWCTPGWPGRCVPACWQYPSFSPGPWRSPWTSVPLSRGRPLALSPAGAVLCDPGLPVRLVLTRSRKLGAILFTFAMMLVVALMVAAASLECLPSTFPSCPPCPAGWGSSVGQWFWFPCCWPAGRSSALW